MIRRPPRSTLFPTRRSSDLTVGTLPGLQETYGSNPFIAACSDWNVRPSGSAVHAAVTSDIPTLVLTGRFDPWSPPAIARKLGASLRTAFFVEVPNWGFRALGDIECVIDIRDAWVDDPTSAPSTPSCLHGLEARFARR